MDRLDPQPWMTDPRTVAVMEALETAGGPDCARFVGGCVRNALMGCEVADVFEVPFSHLMDPANHERRHREAPPGPPRWYWAIVWNERVIWGATAGMVRGLYERLEAARDAEA